MEKGVPYWREEATAQKRVSALNVDFVCNLCGTRNAGLIEFGRETANCSVCRSSVRFRSIAYVLSQELFGLPVPLYDFPVLKGLRGLGMTDHDSYAKVLADKLDYHNTYFDREPRLDITCPPAHQEGTLDFLISSEVFEHVRPPFEKALENAGRLLRPDGVLILTVPYAPKGPALEHFPELDDCGVVHLSGGPVLVNRTAEGEMQVFENLVYHGGSGSTLEMRVLTESELRRALREAGFEHLKFYAEDYPPFGIYHTEAWSLPIAARKQPGPSGARTQADLIRQFARLKEQLHGLEQTNSELIDYQKEMLDWAHGLESELKARTEWARGIDRQLAERTKWAISLETELETTIRDAQAELEARSQRALQSDQRAAEWERECKALRSTRWHRLGRFLRLLR